MYSVISGAFSSDFNTAPEGWHEIDEKQFVQETQFFNYAPDSVENRQILLNGKMIEAWLFAFHDKTGVALSRDYWAGTVQYYAFGCKHDYVELSFNECNKRGIYHAGACWHVRECRLCKHITSCDSSD